MSSSGDLPVSMHYRSPCPCTPSKPSSCTPGPCSFPYPCPCTLGPCNLPRPRLRTPEHTCIHALQTPVSLHPPKSSSCTPGPCRSPHLCPYTPGPCNLPRLCLCTPGPSCIHALQTPMPLHPLQASVLHSWSYTRITPTRVPEPWDRQPSIPAPLQDSGLHEFLHPRSPRPHFLGPNPRSHVYLILVPTPLSSHTPIPCIPLCSRPCTSMHPSIPSSRDLPVSIHYGPTRPCIPSKSASCTPGPCSPPHPYPCTPGTPSRIPAPPPSQHSALLDPAALHIHVPA